MVDFDPGDEINLEEFEVESHIKSVAEDHWRVDDGVMVTVSVYGPGVFPGALKEELAKIRALSTLDMIEKEFGSLEDLFTQERTIDLLEYQGHDTFSGEEEPSYVSRVTPDSILEVFPVEDLEVVTYQFLITR